jgi:Ca2+-dependent lipid-binding protein
VQITLWDEDKDDDDDKIGTGYVSLASFKNGKRHVSIPVYDDKRKETGMLEVDAELLPAGASPAAPVAAVAPAAVEKPVKAEKPKGEMKKAVMFFGNGKVYEKQDVTGFGDPYVSVNVGGKEGRTKTVKNTLNPVWKEGFEKMLKCIYCCNCFCHCCGWRCYGCSWRCCGWSYSCCGWFGVAVTAV